LPELLVGLGVLGFQLRALRCKTLSQLLHLTDGIAKLVQTDVEVALLLLEFFLLLVEKSDVVVDAEGQLVLAP
jgi:hypothetical protein